MVMVMTEKVWELIEYDCGHEGPCLVIRRIPNDHKLGALAMDHRDIGEAIVLELNILEWKLQEEQCRTTPILLETRISDDDFRRIEEMMVRHFGEAGQ